MESYGLISRLCLFKSGRCRYKSCDLQNENTTTILMAEGESQLEISTGIKEILYKVLVVGNFGVGEAIQPM